MFFEKLIPAEDRYREIEQMMTLPEIATDGKRYTALVKEYNSLTPIVEKYREYKDAKKALDDAIEMREDSSLERVSMGQSKSPQPILESMWKRGLHRGIGSEKPMIPQESLLSHLSPPLLASRSPSA